MFLRRQKIAVVELFGHIGGGVKPPAFDRIFSDVLRDRRTRALVLDIDSPGGSVPTSDYIYRRVARIAEAKPVVASIRGVGASGAYFISCAAHKIVASPGSVVGSIGVMSIRPVLQGLFQRIGISVNITKRGHLKDMGAFWRDPTPEEEQNMQLLIDDCFDVFVSIVARARGMDEERVRGLATGEVFWAARAKKLGLVDEVGDLDRAIDLAAELSKARRNPVYLRPRRGLWERLFGLMASSMVDAATDEVEHRLGLNSLRY